MKPGIVIASLACLALGLVATISVVRQSAAPSSAPAPIAVSPEQSSAPETVGTASTAPSPAPAKTFSWREVESADYKTYIANLREIGCPEQTIRDIILADVNRLYADRENPLKTAPKPAADGSAGETPDQKLERLRQLRALQQEKRWVVKELLGIDLPLDMLPSSGNRDYHAYEVALRYIPAEKREAVQMLQETYWQQTDALRAKYNQKSTPESAAEARALKDALRQELAKILTPQELEDYDIRSSSMAKQMGEKLATYFRPSETEFRQIYRAQREYDETIARLSVPGQPAPRPADPEELKAWNAQRAADRQAVQQARTAAQTQLNEQLKSGLGEERYTQYERSQERTYDLLARLGMRYNLPEETVLRAYELQKSFSPGPDMAAGGKAQPANQAEMQRQLNDQLTAILGEQAARGYRRVHGGNVPLR